MTRGDPVCRREDCSPFDIGLVFDEIHNYSPHQKLEFVENVWKPGELPTHFDEIYDQAVTMAEKVGVTPTAPRIAVEQLHEVHHGRESALLPGSNAYQI